MQDAWTGIRNCITSPAVVSSVIILSALLGICAMVLGWRQVSYAHPGPAIATGIWAVIVFAAGLVLRALQVKNEHLSQKLDELQKRLEAPSRLPHIVGLEILVNKWQGFEQRLGEGDSETMCHQLLMSQRIFAQEGIDKITFKKALPGGKLERGVLLVQAENREIQVLKFDRVENIKREESRFANCVSGRFSRYTPGKPIAYWPSRSEWDRASDDEPGAVVYELAQLSRGAPDNLQTFGQYYAARDWALVERALKEILGLMARVWDSPIQDLAHECPRRSHHAGLYYEYARLKEKLPLMNESLQTLIEAGDFNLQTADSGQRLGFAGVSTTDVSWLCHPLGWVHEVFASPDAFGRRCGALDAPNVRRDSIVHGDFHARNILTEEDQGQLRVWLIDFPHTHVGPTIQDIAHLEADIKFSLIPDDALDALDADGLYRFETSLLPMCSQPVPPTEVLTPIETKTGTTDVQLRKAWQAISLLRAKAREYMSGNDARPYYLALLHSTLPMLYYRDRSPRQKLYVLISAALLCERLGA